MFHYFFMKIYEKKKKSNCRVTWEYWKILNIKGVYRRIADDFWVDELKLFLIDTKINQ